MKIKTLYFDMDGVLSDFELGATNLINNLLDVHDEIVNNNSSIHAIEQLYPRLNLSNKESKFFKNSFDKFNCEKFVVKMGKPL